MTNPKSPHIAILNVNIEVMELLPTGECSGKIIPPSQLDIKKNLILSIKGFDAADCVKKLKRKLEQFKKDEA